MSFRLNGVRAPHRKNSLSNSAAQMTGVKTVTIPMSMHIGAPAIPTVKVGDLVAIGDKIAQSGGFVSVPMHASVSGKVTKITEVLTSSGEKVPAVVIESDGEMRASESIAPPTVSDRDSLLSAIRDSGIVGLGGAGFPTHVKFDVDPERIEELIINGAECEPYITSDSFAMITRGEDIERAIRALREYFSIKRIIIGIESNKKKAIRAMREMAERIGGVEVKVLPSIYPQGGEKVLIYHTTQKVVPTGKLPIDVGCVVCNCTTIAAIGEYLATGMPLVSKCITVDGAAVVKPQNVIAPIGTAIGEVFEFCGGFKSAPKKVLYGGPMMGVAVPSLSLPVLKNTNAILALTAREAWLPKTTECIRCGACTNTCPFGLAPAKILKAYNRRDIDMLERLSVETCMLCGCCSFTCPANRPLVQTNALAKKLLKEEKAKEEKKNG